jgi:hypothetical protein
LAAGNALEGVRGVNAALSLSVPIDDKRVREVVTGEGGGPRCQTTPSPKPTAPYAVTLNPNQRLAMRADLLVIPLRDPVCDGCVEAFTANLFASFRKTAKHYWRTVF